MGTVGRNAWWAVLFLVLLAIPAYVYRDQLFLTVAFSSRAQEHIVGQLMVPIAKYGPAILVAVVLFLVVFTRKSPLYCRMTILVSPFIAWGGNRLLKSLFREVRPCDTLSFQPAIPCPVSAADWSFPSGHSAIAAGLAVACVLLCIEIWPLTMALAFLFGYGRVIVGVHYVHDVLIGWAVGIAFTIICVRALTYLAGKITSERRCSMAPIF